MSLSGFKKQFNKTSQYLSEKVGGNKGSELDDDILKLGKKIDVVNECVEDMQGKTKEYLQPNPSARTKLAVLASCQRVRGQSSNTKYTQPEYNLGEVFVKGGMGLERSSPYASSLLDLGSAFKELSDVKDAMEENVQRQFLLPLYETQQQDLKEIANHRKKLESRRLDYDYKRNKGEKIMAEVLQAAEDKFNESIQLCYDSMMNFIENDAEHIAQLHAFTEAVYDYHKQCTDILGSLTKSLSQRLSDANTQPRTKRRIISQISCDSTKNESDYDKLVNDRNSFAPPVIAPLSPPPQPSCRALYDFHAESEGELGFSKGDIIELKLKIDDNWLEGSCNGKYGYFPENFVEILVPL